MKKIKIIMTIGIILITLIGIRFGYLGKQSKEMKPVIGIKSAKLQKCPNKPNCVVSFYSEDSEHYIDPLEMSTFPADELKQIIMNQSGEILDSNDHYIHAIFASKIFGFVDDLELYFDGTNLHFRSASRVGHSDLGVNHKRVELFKHELGKLFPKYR